MNGIPMKWRLIGIAALVIVFSLAGIWGRAAYLKHHAAAEAAQADSSAKQGAIHEAKAEVHDEQAKQDEAQRHADDAKAPDADASVARLKAQNAALRQQLDAAQQGQREHAAVDGAGVHPAADSPELVEHLKALVDSQDQTIQAQDERHQLDLTRIADRDRELKTVYAARDEYKLSTDYFKQQAVQEHAARVAAEGLAKAERLKGRIEGALFGFGLDRGVQALGYGRFK